MRAKDKMVFLQAAKHFNSWILVRRTNKASLEYIGRPGYVPKRFDCKAKTADVDIAPYKLAGLVVNPEIHPKAFKLEKEAIAKKSWQSMRPLMGTIYTVDTNPKSKHYGCLQLQGAYIHGDYDLKAVIDVTQKSRNLQLVEEIYGQVHFKTPRLDAIQQFINSRIGSPMIRHSSDEGYAEHSDEPIDAFAPNGEDVAILNKFAMQHWYATVFEGRRTLAEPPHGTSAS